MIKKPDEVPERMNEDAIPLNANQEETLLETQRELKAAWLRGNHAEARAWAADHSMPSQRLEVAAAVGMLVSKWNLGADDTGSATTFAAPWVNYAAANDLDDRDFLRDEVYWPDIEGTCFLVDASTILTAKHVWVNFVENNADHGSLRAVFGVRQADLGQTALSVDRTDQVYEVAGPAIDTWKDVEGDWIALRLRRDVPVHRFRPLQLSRGSARTASSVVAWGHPQGLALRFAAGEVRAFDASAGMLRCYVDGYGGSSGSPVICEESWAVVGIMVLSPHHTGRVKILTNGDFLSIVSHRDWDNDTKAVAVDVFRDRVLELIGR